jgi:hypothetical protein
MVNKEFPQRSKLYCQLFRKIQFHTENKKENQVCSPHHSNPAKCEQTKTCKQEPSKTQRLKKKASPKSFG